MEIKQKNLTIQCVKILTVELAEELRLIISKKLKALRHSSKTSGLDKLMKPFKKKRLWVKHAKDHQNIPSEIFWRDTSLKFFKSVGIYEDQFTWLLNRISPIIQKQNTLMRDALPAHIKLKSVLAYLIMGGSYQNLSDQFQIPKNSISSFLSDVMSALSNALEEFIKVPDTHNDWKVIENDFKKIYNFPNCYGTLDGKRIEIVKKLPSNSDVMFSNSKDHSYSVILLALIDTNYCFTYISVETNIQGKKDRLVFEDTLLGRKLQINNLNLPSNAVIVANSSFPLKDNLMTPYSNLKHLSTEQSTYNHRLYSVLKLNRNTFKIICKKFRVFNRSIFVGVDKVPTLVKSCCSLHNWLIKTNPLYLETILDSNNSETSHKSLDRALHNIKSFSSSPSITAVEKRSWFENYFSENNILQSQPNVNNIILS